MKPSRWFYEETDKSSVVSRCVLLGYARATFDSLRRCCPENNPESNVTIGVKTGDWVKYNVVRLGQPWSWIPPPMEKAEWVMIKVEESTVSTLKLVETVHFTDGSEETSTLDGNIETLLVHPYVIPANLSAGDLFYLTPNARFSLNKTDARTYGEATREVNLFNRTYLTPQFEYTYNYTEGYCWDRNSGFLLERTYSSFALGYEDSSKSTMSLIVEDTNLWTMNAMPPLLAFLGQNATWLVAGIAITVVAMKIVVSKYSKSKPNSKAT